MNILAKLEKRSRLFWGIMALALMGGVGIVDFLTGYEISLSLFYLIPVGLAAWFLGRPLGIVISVFSAVTWIGAETLSGHPYSQPAIAFWNALIRLGFFVSVAMLLPVLKELEHEKEVSRIDYLTGAINRRFFFEMAQREIDSSQRYIRPFTLAYMDLDDFKMANDQFGHKVGDEILCAVVNSARGHLRKTDILARLGGDEFVIFLPETDHVAAQTTISKIRSILLDEMRKNNWPVTFSIGVLTCLDAQITVDQLIMKTDELMYSVKTNGKNAMAYAIYAD